MKAESQEICFIDLPLPELIGNACLHTSDAAAYLDGELTQAAADDFERHAETCAACRLALNEQRRLLAVLDSALSEKCLSPLPPNFAEEVAARVRSEAGAMRSTAEKRRSLFICVLLCVASCLSLGYAALSAQIESVTVVLRVAVDVAWVFGQTVQAGLLGLSVLLRLCVGGIREAGEHEMPVLVLSLSFVLSLLLLRRLLNRRNCEPCADAN